MLPFGTSFGDAPPALLLLFIALGLDAALGGMNGLFARITHPVVVIGRLISLCDRHWNKTGLPFSVARRRGVGLVVVVVTLCLGIGGLLSFAARTIPYGWVVEIVLAAMLLAQRSLFDHVHAVAIALTRGGLDEGRRAVAMIVGRDPNSLDEFGVARAAVESLAENFSDGVVAPVFYYVLFGLPGLLVYKAVNTLDSMVGYRNATYLAFGWASARLDDVLNYGPARLSGVLFCLAAIIGAKANALRAARTMWRDAGHHRSPNSGWPESAMAGALDLALGGPRRYPGLVVDEPWMGSGRARLGPVDIQLALHLFTIACLLNIGIVAALLWLV